MINTNWLLMPLLIACERAPQSQERQPTVGQQVEAASDSVSHNGVIYRSRAGIVTRDGTERLDVDVDMRNTGSSEIVVESEEGNCNPPIYLQDSGTGREFKWSDIAWRSDPQSKETVCTGTGVLVTLEPRGSGRFVTRSYPLSAIRGDSMPPGLYRLRVAQVVSHADETGRSRNDTLIVPGASVHFR